LLTLQALRALGTYQRSQPLKFSTYKALSYCGSIGRDTGFTLRTDLTLRALNALWALRASNTLRTSRTNRTNLTSRTLQRSFFPRRLRRKTHNLVGFNDSNQHARTHSERINQIQISRSVYNTKTALKKLIFEKIVGVT
jgi:hypothetical protein